MSLEWLTPELIQTLFVGMSLTLIYFAITALYADTTTMNRWQRRIRSSDAPSAVAVSSAQSQHRRSGWQTFLSRLGRAVKPRRQKELTRTSDRLLQAGYRHPNAINVYYGIKFGLMLSLPLLTLAMLWESLQRASTLSASSPLYLGVAAAALVGTFVPDYWLKRRITQRQQQIGRGFPDALDLLVLCIESGLGIDAAMYRVAQDIRLTHPFLSQELQLVTDSIRAGHSRHAALSDLNRRVNLDDIHSFTALIFQTEKLGVSITQSMRKIADAMRAKRRNEAEEMAAKLPVKLLLPVTLLIFPSILVVILMPAGIRLIDALSTLTQ